MKRGLRAFRVFHIISKQMEVIFLCCKLARQVLVKSNQQFWNSCERCSNSDVEKFLVGLTVVGFVNVSTR